MANSASTVRTYRRDADVLLTETQLFDYVTWIWIKIVSVPQPGQKKIQGLIDEIESRRISEAIVDHCHLAKDRTLPQLMYGTESVLATIQYQCPKWSFPRKYVTVCPEQAESIALWSGNLKQQDSGKRPSETACWPFTLSAMLLPDICQEMSNTAETVLSKRAQNVDNQCSSRSSSIFRKRYCKYRWTCQRGKHKFCSIWRPWFK